MIHVTSVTKQNLLAQVTEKSRSMSFRHGWIRVLKHYYQNTTSLSCTSLSVNFMPSQALSCPAASMYLMPCP